MRTKHVWCKIVTVCNICYAYFRMKAELVGYYWVRKRLEWKSLRFTYKYYKIFSIWLNLFIPRYLSQCCGAGAGAGGAEIILDLEPEPKLNF